MPSTRYLDTFPLRRRLGLFFGDVLDQLGEGRSLPLAVGRVQGGTDVLRQGQVGLYLEPGPGLDVLLDIDILGVGHGNEQDRFLLGEGDGEVAASDGLGDELHDLLVDLQHGEVHGLHLPFLRKSLEQLGPGENVLFDEHLLEGFLLLGRLLLGLGHLLGRDQLPFEQNLLRRPFPLKTCCHGH